MSRSEPILIAMLATISATYLLGLWWSHLRTEALLRRQAADLREIARAEARKEARAECDQLGQAVAFQLKGLQHAVAETRQFVEITVALVEEIARIDDTDRHDLLSKGM